MGIADPVINQNRLKNSTRFPWKKPKWLEQKDESDVSTEPQEETRSQTEAISEDGSVGFEPETEQELTRPDEIRDKLGELLVRHGVFSIIRAEQRFELPSDVIEEISRLVEEYKKFKTFEPDKEDENFVIRLANFYYFTGNLKESISLYDAVLKKRPAKVSALNNKGVALDSLEMYDDAIKCFNGALSMAPENLHVLSNKGITLYKKGRYDEALGYLDSALRLDPKYLTALIFMAHSLYRLARRGPALDTYQTALKLDPANGEVLYNMACLHSLNRKENDALVLLEKAIRADSSWKSMASKDKDLENIWNAPKFRELVG